MREMRKTPAWPLLLLSALTLQILCRAPAAGQTGGALQITQSTVAGGGGRSAGGGFSLSGTVGQPTAASSSGGPFRLSGGFWSAAPAAACTYILDQTAQGFQSSGGAGSVKVAAAAGCAWTATSNDSFIEITSGAAGSGGGVVNFTVAPNTGASHRTGTLTIAGQTFTVTQGGTAQPLPAIQFGQATYTVAENFNPANGSNGVAIVVTRTGDLSQGSTVSYATSDTAGLSNCGPNEGAVPGVASQRCDYAAAAGTLRFSPGEGSKTLFLIVIDDAYVEGPESLTVGLSSPVGASLGAPATATVTITDNDVTDGAPNPVDNPAFFVRQQYVDFLNREPDPVGFAGWQNVLNNCPPSGKDTGGNYCDRVEVSAGFFRSPESQARGYFVYRFYRAALGRKPAYAEFIPDLSRVSGFLSDAQLEASKAAFAQAFMARAEFQDKYSALSDPAAYVDALLQTAGVTVSNKQQLIDDLAAGRKSRADVLRAVAESGEVYDRYYTEAFVIMQYFGYLRRDPDILYLEWIRIMGRNGGDYRGMVNGFMNSIEYRRRFGQQ